MQIDLQLCKDNIWRCDCINGGRRLSHYYHQLGCDYLVWYASEVDKLEFKVDDTKRIVRRTRNNLDKKS